MTVAAAVIAVHLNTVGHKLWTAAVTCNKFQSGSIMQVVVGIVGWSAYTKVQTGSGLPAGPSGLLGAAEGFSYLALLGGIIVFGLNAVGV